MAATVRPVYFVLIVTVIVLQSTNGYSVKSGAVFRMGDMMKFVLTYEVPYMTEDHELTLNHEEDELMYCVIPARSGTVIHGNKDGVTTDGQEHLYVIIEIPSELYYQQYVNITPFRIDLKIETTGNGMQARKRVDASFTLENSIINADLFNTTVDVYSSNILQGYATADIRDVYIPTISRRTRLTIEVRYPDYRYKYRMELHRLNDDALTFCPMTKIYGLIDLAAFNALDSVFPTELNMDRTSLSVGPFMMPFGYIRVTIFITTPDNKTLQIQRYLRVLPEGIFSEDVQMAKISTPNADEFTWSSLEDLQIKTSDSYFPFKHDSFGQPKFTGVPGISYSVDCVGNQRLCHELEAQNVADPGISASALQEEVDANEEVSLTLTITWVFHFFAGGERFKNSITKTATIRVENLIVDIVCVCNCRHNYVPALYGVMRADCRNCIEADAWVTYRWVVADTTVVEGSNTKYLTITYTDELDFVLSVYVESTGGTTNLTANYQGNWQKRTGQATKTFTSKYADPWIWVAHDLVPMESDNVYSTYDMYINSEPPTSTEGASPMLNCFIRPADTANMRIQLCKITTPILNVAVFDPMTVALDTYVGLLMAEGTMHSRRIDMPYPAEGRPPPVDLETICTRATRYVDGLSGVLAVAQYISKISPPTQEVINCYESLKHLLVGEDLILARFKDIFYIHYLFLKSMPKYIGAVDTLEVMQNLLERLFTETLQTTGEMKHLLYHFLEVVLDVLAQMSAARRTVLVETVLLKRMENASMLFLQKHSLRDIEVEFIVGSIKILMFWSDLDFRNASLSFDFQTRGQRAKIMIPQIVFVETLDQYKPQGTWLVKKDNFINIMIMLNDGRLIDDTNQKLNYGSIHLHVRTKTTDQPFQLIPKSQPIVLDFERAKVHDTTSSMFLDVEEDRGKVVDSTCVIFSVARITTSNLTVAIEITGHYNYVFAAIDAMYPSESIKFIDTEFTPFGNSLSFFIPMVHSEYKYSFALSRYMFMIKVPAVYKKTTRHKPEAEPEDPTAEQEEEARAATRGWLLPLQNRGRRDTEQARRENKKRERQGVEAFRRNTRKRMEVYVRIHRTQCYVLFNNRWSIKPFCKHVPVSAHYLVRCQCYGGSTFTAKRTSALQHYMAFEPNKLDYHGPTIIPATFVVFSITLFLYYVYWSYFQDLRETNCNQTHAIKNMFNPDSQEQYLVCISTAAWPNSGTSARVSFLLVGENASHKTVMPEGDFCYSTGSDVWFLLSSNLELGHITAVIVSYDKFVSGSNLYPWNLRNVVVYNKRFNHVSIFRANQMLGIHMPTLVLPAVPHQYEWGGEIMVRYWRIMKAYHVLGSVVFHIPGKNVSRTLNALTSLCVLITSAAMAVEVIGAPKPVYHLNKPSDLTSSAYLQKLAITSMFSCLFSLFIKLLFGVVFRKEIGVIWYNKPQPLQGYWQDGRPSLSWLDLATTGRVQDKTARSARTWLTYRQSLKRRRRAHFNTPRHPHPSSSSLHEQSRRSRGRSSRARLALRHVAFSQHQLSRSQERTFYVDSKEDLLGAQLAQANLKRVVSNTQKSDNANINRLDSDLDDGSTRDSLGEGAQNTSSRSFIRSSRTQGPGSKLLSGYRRRRDASSSVLLTGNSQPCRLGWLHQILSRESQSRVSTASARDSASASRSVAESPSKSLKSDSGCTVEPVILRTDSQHEPRQLTTNPALLTHGSSSSSPSPSPSPSFSLPNASDSSCDGGDEGSNVLSRGASGNVCRRRKITKIQTDTASMVADHVTRDSVSGPCTSSSSISYTAPGISARHGRNTSLSTTESKTRSKYRSRHSLTRRAGQPSESGQTSSSTSPRPRGSDSISHRHASKAQPYQQRPREVISFRHFYFHPVVAKDGATPERCTPPQSDNHFGFLRNSRYLNKMAKEHGISGVIPLCEDQKVSPKAVSDTRTVHYFEGASRRSRHSPTAPNTHYISPPDPSPFLARKYPTANREAPDRKRRTSRNFAERDWSRGRTRRKYIELPRGFATAETKLDRAVNRYLQRLAYPPTSSTSKTKSCLCPWLADKLCTSCPLDPSIGSEPSSAAYCPSSTSLESLLPSDPSPLSYYQTPCSRGGTTARCQYDGRYTATLSREDPNICDTVAMASQDAWVGGPPPHDVGHHYFGSACRDVESVLSPASLLVRSRGGLAKLRRRMFSVFNKSKHPKHARLLLQENLQSRRSALTVVDEKANISACHRRRTPSEHIAGGGSGGGGVVGTSYRTLQAGRSCSPTSYVFDRTQIRHSTAATLPVTSVTREQRTGQSIPVTFSSSSSSSNNSTECQSAGASTLMTRRWVSGSARSDHNRSAITISSPSDTGRADEMRSTSAGNDPSDTSLPHTQSEHQESRQGASNESSDVQGSKEEPAPAKRDKKERFKGLLLERTLNSLIDLGAKVFAARQAQPEEMRGMSSIPTDVPHRVGRQQLRTARDARDPVSINRLPKEWLFPPKLWRDTLPPKRVHICIRCCYRLWDFITALSKIRGYLVSIPLVVATCWLTIFSAYWVSSNGMYYNLNQGIQWLALMLGVVTVHIAILEPLIFLMCASVSCAVWSTPLLINECVNRFATVISELDYREWMVELSLAGRHLTSYAFQQAAPESAALFHLHDKVYKALTTAITLPVTFHTGVYWLLLYTACTLVLVNLQSDTDNSSNQKNYIDNVFGLHKGEEVTTVENMWDFLEYKLIPGLHRVQEHVNGSAVSLVLANLTSDNILGCMLSTPVRFRQIRARPDKHFMEGRLCNPVRNIEIDKRRQCNFEFTSEMMETRDFGRNWNDFKPEDGPTRYLYEEDDYNIFATIDLMPQSGYTSVIDFHEHGSLQKFQNVRHSDWIDEHTRYVIVDFTLVNNHAFIISTIRIRFDFRLAAPFWHISSFHFPFQNQADNKFYVLIVNAFIFFIFSVYNILKELLMLYRIGVVAYLSRFSSYLEVIKVMLSVVLILVVVRKNKLAPELLQQLKRRYALAGDSEYIDFLEMAVMDSASRTAGGFLAFVCIFQIFDMLSKIRRLLIFIRLLISAITLFFMPLIAAIAFSFLSNILFGATNENFSYLGISYLMVNQYFIKPRPIYDALTDNHPYIGPWFVFTLGFCVNFFIVNFFIVFLNEAYSSILNQIRIESYKVREKTKLEYVYEFLGIQSTITWDIEDDLLFQERERERQCVSDVKYFLVD